MSKISMLYREIAPPHDISHLILSFWEFTVSGESAAPVIHEVFPEGCISLIYKRNSDFGVSALFVHGLSLEMFETQVFPGDLFWGMRFMPSACAKILQQNPARVQSHPVDDSKDFPHLTKGLLEKLARCRSCDEAIEVFKYQLESLKIKREDTDEKIVEAIKIIEENRGEIKISEVAAAVSLSTRQLERRFKTSAGLSPKQFARARRIRATAISFLEETNLNWANRAAEMGFTDQSHLTREVSQLTGRTPNAFAEKVKYIEHGNFVK